MATNENTKCTDVSTFLFAKRCILGRKIYYRNLCILFGTCEFRRLNQCCAKFNMHDARRNQSNLIRRSTQLKFAVPIGFKRRTFDVPIVSILFLFSSSSQLSQSPKRVWIRPSKHGTIWYFSNPSRSGYRLVENQGC